MESIKADAEDQREIINAGNIIIAAIVKNKLPIIYVMEALQALYAHQASEIVSYEQYCQKIDLHKESFREMWGKNQK